MAKQTVPTTGRLLVYNARSIHITVAYLPDVLCDELAFRHRFEQLQTHPFPLGMENLHLGVFSPLLQTKTTGTGATGRRTSGLGTTETKR